MRSIRGAAFGAPTYAPLGRDARGWGCQSLDEWARLLVDRELNAPHLAVGSAVVGGVAGQDPHCSGRNPDFMLVRKRPEPDPDRTFGPGEGVGLHQFLPQEMV